MKPAELRIKLQRAIRGALGPRNSAAVVEILNLPTWLFFLDDMHRKNAQEVRSLRESLKEFETELGQALRAAKRVKRMVDQPLGLKIPDSDDYRATSWLTACERMLGEAQEMSDRMTSKGGRPRKTGPFQTALAMWGALDRTGVGQRRRPAVIRECFGAIGLEPGEAESAIKAVRKWFKDKRN